MTNLGPRDSPGCPATTGGLAKESDHEWHPYIVLHGGKVLLWGYGYIWKWELYLILLVEYK